LMRGMEEMGQVATQVTGQLVKEVVKESTGMIQDSKTMLKDMGVEIDKQSLIGQTISSSTNAVRQTISTGTKIVDLVSQQQQIPAECAEQAAPSWDMDDVFDFADESGDDPQRSLPSLERGQVMGMDLVSSEGLLTFEEAFEQLSGAVLIEQLEASAATAQLRVQLEKRTKSGSAVGAANSVSVVSQLLQVSEQESTDKGIDEQMPEDCESANQIEEAASGWFEALFQAQGDFRASILTGNPEVHASCALGLLSKTMVVAVAALSCQTLQQLYALIPDHKQIEVVQSARLARQVLAAAVKHMSGLHRTYCDILDQISIETRDSLQLHTEQNANAEAISKLQSEIQSMRTNIYITVGSGETNIEEGKVLLTSILAQ